MMKGFIVQPARNTPARVNERTRQHASRRADVNVQVRFMRSILRMRALHDITTKAGAQLINKFTNSALCGCMVIVVGMNGGTAISPAAPARNVRFVCSGGCHADRATKKWGPALAATHTCGSQQNSLNTFAAFMLTQMHALYARTQNGPQVSRVTGGCAKVDGANDRR
jgi:hypothetical protein